MECCPGSPLLASQTRFQNERKSRSWGWRGDRCHLGRARDLQAHSLRSNTPSHFRQGPRQSRLCAWRLPPHTLGRWHEYQPNIVDEETGSHGVCDLQHHGTEPSSNPPCQSPEFYVGRAQGTLGKRQVREGQPAWQVGGVQNRPHCPFCGKDET